MNEEEEQEAGERWCNHEGPYMTLSETLMHSQLGKELQEWLENAELHIYLSKAEGYTLASVLLSKYNITPKEE